MLLRLQQSLVLVLTVIGMRGLRLGYGGETWNFTDEVSEIGLVSLRGTGAGEGGSCPCTAPQAADYVAMGLAIL